MYKEDLALNNLQWLICHKTKPNQTKPVKYILWNCFKQTLPKYYQTNDQKDLFKNIKPKNILILKKISKYDQI